MKSKEIIDLLDNPIVGGMTAKQVAEKLEGDYEATRKLLYRMENKGILRSENDWCQETNGYPKYYSLADHKPEINPEKIVEEMVEYCNQTHHPALTDLPVKYGGKQTTGSGHLSAWKSAIAILVEMGKL